MGGVRKKYLLFTGFKIPRGREPFRSNSMITLQINETQLPTLPILPGLGIKRIPADFIDRLLNSTPAR